MLDSIQKFRHGGVFDINWFSSVLQSYEFIGQHMEIVHAAGSYALTGIYRPDVLNCRNYGSESGPAPDIDRKTYLGDAC